MTKFFGIHRRTLRYLALSRGRFFDAAGRIQNGTVPVSSLPNIASETVDCLKPMADSGIKDSLSSCSELYVANQSFYIIR